MAYTNRQRIADYRKVFSTPEGKRVLADLCANNYVFAGTYDVTEHTMAFNEGRRNTVLDILKWLNTKPEQVRQIIEDIDERLGFSTAGAP